MTTPTTLTEKSKTCRRLRWKGLYIEVEPDPLVPETSDGMFWCSHTQTCLGPDGAVAERGKCGPDRGCFEGLGRLRA